LSGVNREWWKINVVRIRNGGLTIRDSPFTIHR